MKWEFTGSPPIIQQESNEWREEGLIDRGIEGGGGRKRTREEENKEDTEREGLRRKRKKRKKEIEQERSTGGWVRILRGVGSQKGNPGPRLGRNHPRVLKKNWVKGCAHGVARELLTQTYIASLQGAFMGGTYFCCKAPRNPYPFHEGLDL
jgi:hypothetical protein